MSFTPSIARTLTFVPFKRRNKTTGTNADRHIGQVGFMLTDLTDIDKTAQAVVSQSAKQVTQQGTPPTGL